MIEKKIIPRLIISLVLVKTGHSGRWRLPTPLVVEVSLVSSRTWLILCWSHCEVAELVCFSIKQAMNGGTLSLSLTKCTAATTLILPSFGRTTTMSFNQPGECHSLWDLTFLGLRMDPQLLSPCRIEAKDQEKDVAWSWSWCPQRLQCKPVDVFVLSRAQCSLDQCHAHIVWPAWELHLC